MLILREPDLGSALVLLPITLVMMFTAGVPVSHLRRLVTGAGLVGGPDRGRCALCAGEFRIPLEDYQRDRLLVYFGRDFAPRSDTPAERQRSYALQQKKSYNVEQALISVGSGGLTGKGWRQGTQNALGYLPRAVAHNDFIFSVIAEEKGFLGSVIVITLYTVVLFTGIQIAGQARDRLGKTPGDRSGHHALQPCLHQHRHEHSLNARDGYPTAAAKLRRDFSALLVDRRWPFAEHPSPSRFLLI